MKKIQFILAACFLLFASAAVAGESYRVFKVDAVDRNAAILFDGKEQKLSTKPLLINGKMMVSVRDAARIFNKEVVWSEKYNLVDFTSNSKVMDFPTEPQAQAIKPAQASETFRYIEKMKVLRNVGPFYQLAKRKIAIAGTLYSHGVVVDLDPTKAALKTTDQSPKTKAEVKIFLNGNYSGMEGYLGVDDSTMNSKAGFVLRLYNDGVLRTETEMIEPGELAYFLSSDLVGDLSNTKILKIEIEQEDMAPSPGDTVKTKVALANMKFYRK